MGCHSSEPAPIKDDSNGKSKQNQEKIESNICQIQKKENDIEQEEQGRIEICSIPIMPLRNINCDMIKIPSNKTKGMRAVVITDTHLGKFKYAKPSIPILFDELKKIVEDNNSNCIIWLGDTIDIKAEDRNIVAQDFLDTFSEFPVPIRFISGNHDRGLYKRLNVHGSIHYFHHKIMKIESSTGDPIFFSHDFGNSFRISNPDVPSFIWSNKIAQQKLIPIDNWLIIGHVHTLYVNNEVKIASLAPFSIDIQSYCYALVNDSENGFDISFHKLKTKSNIADIVKKIETQKNSNVDD